MKENNKEEDKELRIILRKDDTEIVKKLKDILSKKDVEDLFVDFGQGDKFLIHGINDNEKSHSIIFSKQTQYTMDRDGSKTSHKINK